MQLSVIDKKILQEVADLHEIPAGAYNLRKDGQGAGRNTTSNIDIITKTDKQGIDVKISPGTKGESVYIPVILSKTITDIVYNTFEVGANSDVTIISGCGIHNSGSDNAQHDGVHEFFVRKNAKMKYIEKHYGEGDGTGQRILNPQTKIYVEEGGIVELETVQIKGVDRTIRDTNIILEKDAKLIVTERLLTNLDQTAESNIIVELRGENSTAQIISRSVAQDDSVQIFRLTMRGYSNCRGHIQCDSIIMDNGRVSSIPEVSAYHADAQLIHEAAIGKISSEQLVKLMTLGLTEEEAEETILQGFLK